MLFPIKVVAKRTGLSSHVIRAWENRYGAVKPQRSHGYHRLYCEDDVIRLQLLREVTQAGFSIGRVANLPMAELEALLTRSGGQKADGKAPTPDTARAEEDDSKPQAAVDLLLRATVRLDTEAMESLLQQATIRWGAQGTLTKVIVPLTEKIGEMWMQGELKVAHEHFASGIIRAFLTSAHRPFALMPNAPRIVMTTPVGQMHELGAAIAAAGAASQGWQVTYLGTSLPAGEIAAAVSIKRARAVGLSIVYPPDDLNLGAELMLLRQLLPMEAAIIVGGRSAPGYASVLKKIGACVCQDLPGFYRKLESLRV